MAAGGGGEETRSFEEDIYWTHFHFTHFAQFIRNNDFHQRLALPKTYSDNKKYKLPEIVSLKGPGSSVWNAKLTTIGDTMYFTQGWEQFVNDNSVKKNDFLIFKYNGDSLFDVLIFDGESCCETVTPYFIRECKRVNVEQHANAGQHANVDQHINGEQHANGKLHANGDLHANDELHANGELHPNLEQQSGGGNSKKRDREDSAENVNNTPSNAGVEVADAWQFAADGGTITEPSDVPSQTRTTGNKRIKRSANKPRGRPRKSINSPAPDLIFTESNGNGIDAKDLLL